MSDTDRGAPALSGPALDEVKAAWAQCYDGLAEAASHLRVRAFAALIRGIAKTGAVTPDDFGRQGIAILSVREGSALAQERWVERLRRAES